MPKRFKLLNHISLRNFKEHLIETRSSVESALKRLDQLASDAILFVVDKDDKLIGSLTDGDVRRGLLKGFTIENQVNEIIQPDPKFIRKGNYDINNIIGYRERHYDVLPVIDKSDHVVNVVNFKHLKSYLPVDAIIMAGGKGSRLRPLTEKTPKPLLKVGEKPIIEHNIDRLSLFGIDDFWLSVNYLGEQIKDYFKKAEKRNISIHYVDEDKPLGTIGALSLVDNFQHDYVLLTNSDILTNLDYEDFFLEFINQEADLSVVTIPYRVNIPYAVLETDEKDVKSFKEKPTYTYYSNGGIYLLKKEVVKMLPKNQFYNATDLMENLINHGKKVTSYPMAGYWLDIGKHEDFKKAQEDIKHIKF